MNLADMRALVRRDLHDEDSENYRWTDDELDRHIAHAAKDYSGALPLEQKAAVTTIAGSREIDISSISDRVNVEAIEYPVGKFPPRYQRFALWGDIITLLGSEVPDGSDAYTYYGKLHTLDSQDSTIPVHHEDLVVTGACGYAAAEWAIYAINRVNTGGVMTPDELTKWGKDKLVFFRSELRRLGRNNRVRVRQLYASNSGPVSRSSDPGS